MAYQYKVTSIRPLCPSYPCQVYTMNEIISIFDFYFLNQYKDKLLTKIKERNKLIRALINSNTKYFTYFFTQKLSTYQIRKSKFLVAFDKELPIIYNIPVSFTDSHCFIASVETQEFNSEQIAYLQKLPSKILNKLFNRIVFANSNGCLLTNTFEAHLFKDQSSIRVVVIKGNVDNAFNYIKKSIVKLI